MLTTGQRCWVANATRTVGAAATRIPWLPESRRCRRCGAWRRGGNEPPNYDVVTAAATEQHAKSSSNRAERTGQYS